jgi:hypothetical protein
MAGYGLRPVGVGYGGLSGYNNGGFVEVPISTDAAVDIYTGDFLEYVNDASGAGSAGVVRQANDATGETPTTTTANTMGVAVGFRYVTAQGVPTYSQFYDQSASNTEAFAYVCADPNQIYLIQSDGAITIEDIGKNAPVDGFAVSEGNSTTGLSGIQLDHSDLDTTAADALRVVGIPDNGSNRGSATPDVLVRINTGVLFSDQGTGIV